MKTALVLLAIAAIVLACGCTAADTNTPPAAPVAPAEIPDLTGTWTGTMTGYDDGIGFNDHAGGTATLVITGQQGRVFAGNLTVTEGNVSLFSGGFAGVIGRDGRTLSVVEESGYCTGEIVDDNTLEFVYMDDNPPFAIAIDTFRRVA